MIAHYITLYTVQRALLKSCNVGVFMRQAAISSPWPGIHRSKWIPAELHKQP